MRLMFVYHPAHQSPGLDASFGTADLLQLCLHTDTLRTDTMVAFQRLRPKSEQCVCIYRYAMLNDGDAL